MARAAKKAPAKKAAPKKAAAKKAPAKKAPAKKAAPAPAKRYAATPAGATDRGHLLNIVKTNTNCTNQAAKDTLDEIFGTVAATLKKNQRVQLIGFGTFEVRKRRARKGRNPQTGESIRIKASKNVAFKAGKALRDKI